ncbi:isochorismatase family protein [Cytobacillus sp.]|uniref:isochorismatase family protein n=1 Tax=Cytobacillus sp. TaxID=2675269 RepID=UPI0035119E6F
MFLFKAFVSPPRVTLYHKSEHGISIKDLLAPKEGEKVFAKNVTSAFIGTELEIHHRQSGIKSVVITGLSSQDCVSTTSRMRGNLGFVTHFVSDSIAAFEITDHRGQSIHRRRYKNWSWLLGIMSLQ